MAFLMLLHEKMRLQRKVNKLTLRQAQASSRKERVTKQIERVQKMYSKREANLEQQAKRMENQASLFFKNAFGLASNMINTNYTGYLSGGINNAGVMQTLMQGIQSGALSLKKPDSEIELTEEELKEFLLNPGSKYGRLTKDGKTWLVPKAEYDEYYKDTSNWTPSDEASKLTEKYEYAQYLQNRANMQYQNNQSLCTNATTNYQTNISIWLEYEKEKLEAEQDAALLPLQEQETEWDMESTSAETQLADARERLNSIKQALSKGIKDSAPTFGLG